MAVNQARGAGTISAGRSWVGFLLVALSLVVEGFDLQAANFAGPSIIDHFGVSKAELGPLQSASLVGLLIGAVSLAPFGDRFGRRAVLIAGCIFYGLFSLISAAATGFNELIILRFVIGIGLGAVLPNALALAGEFAPEKLLASAAGLVSIGITFGGTVAGATSATFFRLGYGWQEIFLTGGTLPMAIALLLWLALPESPALATGAKPEKAGNVLQLLTPNQRAQTVAIWLAFALVLMVTYLLNGWVPLVVKDQGFSTENATWIATAGHAGGVVGGIFASIALSRTRWPVVAFFGSIAAVVMLLLASRNWEAGMLAGLVALQGFFSVGTQNGLNGSAGAHYPARTRALGLGWALGMGRVGSILGPLAGSAAVLLGLGAPRHFFYLPILPLLIAALLALYLARATRAQRPAPQGD